LIEKLIKTSFCVVTAVNTRIRKLVKVLEHNNTFTTYLNLKQSVFFQCGAIFSYDSQNKQQLFHQRVLTGWSLYEDAVFSVTYELNA
jgi:hypothetical protein